MEHRTFLEAGKHVCVEYPMAMTHKTAVDLWDLAQEKGELDIIIGRDLFWLIRSV
jgi:predicted dehydrogenase